MLLLLFEGVASMQCYCSKSHLQLTIQLYIVNTSVEIYLKLTVPISRNSSLDFETLQGIYS